LAPAAIFREILSFRDRYTVAVRRTEDPFACAQPDGAMRPCYSKHVFLFEELMGSTASSAELKSAYPKRRRRSWLQFSLRTFLLGSVAISVCLAWIAYPLLRVRHRRAVVAHLASVGGKAFYPTRESYDLAEADARKEVGFLLDGGIFYVSRYQEHPRKAQTILRYLFGDEAFNEIGFVVFDHRAKVADADLARLVELPQLESVRINSQSISDKGVANLARIRTMRELSLDNVGITGIGIRCLEHLSALEDLTLSGQSITDDVVNEISRLQSLRSLRLLRTNITPVSISALEKLTNLEFLAVCDNPHIGDEVLRCAARLPKLERLNLRRTDCTDKGLAKLSQLKNLRVLNVGECPRISDDGIGSISEVVELRVLDLSHIPLGDSGVALLRNLHKLEVLNLNHTQITSAALDELGKLSNLRQLEFYGTSVADDGLPQLQTLTQMEFLELGPYVSLEAASELKTYMPRGKITGLRGQLVNQPHFTVHSNGSVTSP
jgi:hypothetical protein